MYMSVQIPNFHSLSALSLLAALMSITYSTIAIGASAHDADPNAEYNLDGGGNSLHCWPIIAGRCHLYQSDLQPFALQGLLMLSVQCVAAPHCFFAAGYWVIL